MSVENPEGRIISPRAVAALTSLSRSSIFRLAKKEAFPKPIQLSPCRKGWRENDVKAWVASRAEAA